MAAKKVDRAAQFLPFDAMKGLQEELRAREEKHSRVEKIDLSEQQTENLSNSLYRIEKGNLINLVFYKSGHYFCATGIVSKIDKIYKYLIIGEERIFFDNIYSISQIVE